jgi:sarcosine oxidase
MVRAQLTLANAAGASIIPWPATLLSGGSRSKPVTVTAADGTTAIGDRLLLATGPYGASLAGVTHPMERRLRTVALLELTRPGPELPAVIMSDLNRRGLTGIYWVPPIHYPDGGVYLKIGGEPPLAPVVTDHGGTDVAAAIAEWFNQGGSADEVADLVAIASEILPDRGVRLAGSKPCVVSVTPDDRPILEWVDDRIATAFGGCGSAAKSADAIGFDAAALVTA